MSGVDPTPPDPAHPDPAPLGPGALVLVVGPSGAGKDTLMAAAQALLAGRTDIHMARRRVTRTDTTGEDHTPMDPATFAAELAAGRYPLAWQAHGLSYALGQEVADAIRAGQTVMANGSRATLPEARRRFARPYVVLVTAPPHVLAARLAARGREAVADIEARLRRLPAVDVQPDLVIENIGAVADGAARLAAFIGAVSTPA